MKSSIDSSSVERELQDLWKGVAHEGGEEGELLRSCVLNLVACTEPGEGAAQASSELAQANTAQPGRLILLLPQADSAQEGFEARVTAHCHLQPGGRNQVCGELIQIHAHGSAVDRAASVVVPLLVPDLPVFVWWRRPLDVEAPLFRGLFDMATRLIVDSSDERSIQCLGQLAGLVSDDAGVGVSDLSWARLAVWRRALAGLYDSSQLRHLIRSPARISISYGRSEAELGVDALYCVGWLAGRLGWRESDPLVPLPGSMSCRFQTEGGQTDVRLEADPGSEIGIRTIQISDGDGDRVVMRLDAQGGLETTVTLDGVVQSRQVLMGRSAQESLLVARELEILERDRVFEDTLRFLAHLVKFS